MRDFHVHSSFSADCAYSMEEMTSEAIKKGIKTITFTDHVDYDYGDYDYKDLFIFKPSDYLEEVTRLKEKYSGKIDILSGVEMGMQPHLVSTVEDMFPFDDFEFTIMSIHTSKRKDLHEGDFFKEKTSLQSYLDYYEELLYCVENFNNYQVIGHLNLIDRYSKYLSEEVPFSKYSDLIEVILRKIIESGKGIEVNTSGFRYGMGTFLPNIDMINLYKSLGGEIITFGSDSHTPEDIGDNYKRVIDALKSVGFEYISYFKDNDFKFDKI